MFAVRVWIGALFLFISTAALGNGVGVVDATKADYLRLKESHVRVSVDNQVALITATETFFNPFDTSVKVNYAFPLPAGASATSLRWKIGGVWYDAQFNASPADTTLPGSGNGGGVDPNLSHYLGDTPLYFDISQFLGSDSLLTVQVTYAQLLPYAFGDVTFTYPNDYSLIQAQPLDAQLLNFSLTSTRTIQTLELLSHRPDRLTNDGLTATIYLERLENYAQHNYEVRYTLNPDELGLFGFSTFLPDSLRLDESDAGGYFAFIAEPDPTERVDVIDKVFTLIVDRSGSMRGPKIVQARNAAQFIIDNLNEGDRFNIVDFSSDVRSFRGEHVLFSEATKDAALAYVSTFEARGGTAIADAFSTTVPQFDVANAETANIIVFFTDGQATVGLTNTDAILTHVDRLMQQYEVDASVFTFGIGDDANRQLLTRLASQNNGLSEFLGADELETRLTEFYLQIRNPVLLETQLAFSPDVITEIYPDPLPNLYKGQQMLVAGRYSTPGDVTVTLSGTAFGQPIIYTYPLTLNSTHDTGLQFLPKVWAKLKLEALLVTYYSLDAHTETAERIRDEIVNLSLAYGVLSPFTSFRGGIISDDQSDGTGVAAEVEEDRFEIPNAETPIDLLGNYPNPFADQTTIRFRVNTPMQEVVLIKVYDMLGRVVRLLAVPVSGQGIYEVQWDGLDATGQPVAAGTYVFSLSVGDVVLGGTLVRSY